MQQKLFATSDSNVLPVITLYQPWATWIIRGWKTVETRTHDRFRCLDGKTILIHAGQNTDKEAFNNVYLTKQQLMMNEGMVNGFILGSAYAQDLGCLDPMYEVQALIECETLRWGLLLSNVTMFEKPIPVKGGMGIWYFNMDSMQKVKKRSTSGPNRVAV